MLENTRQAADASFVKMTFRAKPRCVHMNALPYICVEKSHYIKKINDVM